MPDAPQRRRFVSPALLLAILLCFFLPFFSVSCTAGVGQMRATVTGMDQVFGGEPEYTGFRPPPTAQGTTAVAEQNSRVSPPALIGFAAIVVGIGVGLGLPRARARWMAGAATSGIALVAVVVNQVMAHDRAQEALGGVGSSFRSQLGNNPIFGRSIPTSMFELDDESGFWVVTVLLAVVLAYNVYEVVVSRRGSNRPELAAGCAGVPQTPPVQSGRTGAGGWPQAAPPRQHSSQPTDAWPAPQHPQPDPQDPAPGYPAGDRQPPHQPPPAMPGYPPSQA
ncbi:MAG: hypothetical protein JNM77_06960 [Pseudonocardia sp.]|nr:hypothetical protein [Pseudonocardia sp.]